MYINDRIYSVFDNILSRIGGIKWDLEELEHQN